MKENIYVAMKDSLDDGLGEEGGIAGLGGIVEHGLPIFEGGLSPDGFGSVMFYVLTVTRPATIIARLVIESHKQFV